MSFQYFVVAIVVLVVIVLQYRSFRKNILRIGRIKNLFSKHEDCYIYRTEDTIAIRNAQASGDFQETIDDINVYLDRNKNKTYDYQILKEITDRNSDTIENEVDTMISAPLYLGLIATIFGIAFGVVVFAWKDLSNLLSGADLSPEGIKILLTDVGIAMVASLFGVFFTKQATEHLNEARSQMARDKNRFLSWIQSDLMSKLSDDITGALIKMTQDLNEFNSSFAGNTKELKETLKIVSDNYEGQVKLIESIQNLKIAKIAKANIEVYDRLQACTSELEHLFEIFSNSESYLAKVVELNSAIGSVESRTRLFEDLGIYFREEGDYIRDRQGTMRLHLASLDSVLQDAMSSMSEGLRSNLQDMTTSFVEQNMRIREMIDSQEQSIANLLDQQNKSLVEQISENKRCTSVLDAGIVEELKEIKESFLEQSSFIKNLYSSLMPNSSDKKIDNDYQCYAVQNDKMISDLIKEVSFEIRELRHQITVSEQNTLKQQSSSTNVTSTPNNNSRLSQFCTMGSFIILLVILILQIVNR